MCSKIFKYVLIPLLLVATAGCARHSIKLEQSRDLQNKSIYMVRLGPDIMPYDPDAKKIYLYQLPNYIHVLLSAELEENYGLSKSSQSFSLSKKDWRTNLWESPLDKYRKVVSENPSVLENGLLLSYGVLNYSVGETSGIFSDKIRMINVFIEIEFYDPRSDSVMSSVPCLYGVKIDLNLKKPELHKHEGLLKMAQHCTDLFMMESFGIPYPKPS